MGDVTQSKSDFIHHDNSNVNLGNQTIDREAKKEGDEAMDDDDDDMQDEDGENRELFSGLLGNGDEGILEK